MAVPHLLESGKRLERSKAIERLERLERAAVLNSGRSVGLAMATRLTQQASRRQAVEALSESLGLVDALHVLALGLSRAL